MKLPALKEIIEERKGKAIENLSTSFAKNKLPLEEYERLVEYINKIESERELVVVEKIVDEYDRSGSPDNSRDYSPDYSADTSASDYGGQSFGPFRGSLSTGVNMAILSSRNISGPLKSGSQYMSILGSSQIKVKKEDLSKQRTELNVVSLLGDNTIYVEGGIRVINNAIPVLGGSWTDNKVNKQAQEGGPILIISGAAILGNVTVKLLKE